MACTSDRWWLQRTLCDQNTSTWPVHQTDDGFKEHCAIRIPQHGLYIRQTVASRNTVRSEYLNMACTSDRRWLQRTLCDQNTSTWPVHQTEGDFKEHCAIRIPQHGLYIRQSVASRNTVRSEYLNMACTSDRRWLQGTLCDHNTSTWPVHQTDSGFKEHCAIRIPQHGLYIRQRVTSRNAVRSEYLNMACTSDSG